MVPHLASFLAFSAVFFFGPVVKKKLSDYETMLTREEMDFVLSYCGLGTILLGCGLVGFVLSIVLSPGSWMFFFVSSIVPCLMIMMMGRAGYCILQKQPWIWFGGWHVSHRLMSVPTQGDLVRIVTDFLPGWSVWQRYVHGHWKSNYRWTKEAMVLRTVRAVQHLAIGSGFVSGCIFFLILARVATLRANLDFVPQQWKQAVNRVVRTSLFDIVLYGSRWLWHRVMRVFHRSPLDVSYDAGDPILRADDPKPPAWWVPHSVMIGCCCVGLRHYWLVVSSSLWGMVDYGTTIAWLLIVIHPCALLKAGFWFPLFHQGVQRCWLWIQRLIAVRKKNTDPDMVM